MNKIVKKGNGKGELREEEIGSTNNFGFLIKFYRQLRNYSLKELECASGGEVSSSYIHRLETGERNPSINKILQLAKALRIPSSVLVATLLHGLEEEEKTFSLSEVLIKNNYFLGSGMLNSEAIAWLIRIVEHIDLAKWSPSTKMREMYELSELIDGFKQAMN